MKNRGFTLVELLTVIAIIGILSSITLSSLNESREKAKIAKAKEEIYSIRIALELLYDDTGKYVNGCPDSEESDYEAIFLVTEEYNGLVERPPVGTFDPANPQCTWTASEVARWNGPYVRSGGDFIDPWGHPYYVDFDYWGYTGVDEKPGCPDLLNDGAAIVSIGKDNDSLTCDDIASYLRVDNTTGGGGFGL